MAGLADEGMLYKATETLRVFSQRRPSLGTLWRNRSQYFDAAHLILPSTATTGESLEGTLQAWDQCERPTDDADATFALDSTDPEATYPERLSFPARNSGVATVPGIGFETPGVQYLTVTHETIGERFVSNPVRVSEDGPRRARLLG